ncbi:MAG TPA: S41 family peptidase [Puia sp.]|jgi:hypothetical protein
MKLPFVTLVAVTALFFFPPATAQVQAPSAQVQHATAQVQPASAQLTPQQQKNLTAFAHLYGYVRFFHPSDEAAAWNWDRFAIYGAQQVMTAGDDPQLIDMLQALFHPFAPTVVIYPSGQKQSFSISSITPPDTTGYLPVAWQHDDVGLGNNIYKSIRVNRPGANNTTTQTYAVISQSFPADLVKGREFRLTAWVKTDTRQGGESKVWMRISKGKTVGYFNTTGGAAAQPNTWTEYTLTGKASDQSDKVTIGAWLANRGRMLLDQVQLFIKVGARWKEVPLSNGGFEKDSSSVPASWTFDQQQTLYHFASETNDVRDGTHALSIVSVANPSATDEPPAKPLFNHYPHPGEYIHESLAPGIECIVPLALYGNRSHTWPIADTAQLSRLTEAMCYLPGTLSGDQLVTRLGDVVISWNFFRHFFPYWEDASAAPDQLLATALNRAATDANRYDFLQTLRKMTAPLNDGHLHVIMNDDTTFGSAYIPVYFAWAGNQLVVDRITDSSLRKTVHPGDIVTAIDGQPRDAYLDTVNSMLCGSPQFLAFHDVFQLIQGTPHSRITLTLKGPAGVRDITLTREGNWDKDKNTPGPQTHPSGWIKPGIFYLDLGRVPMDSIDAWMPQLTRARAIICDIREYPMNNSDFIKHLLTIKDTTKWMWIPEITYPNYQKVAYHGGGWSMTPASRHLDGKIFFIADGGDISYAESYLGFIKDFHLATIVGQPTAGTNGNPNPVYIPGGYRIAWSGMRVTGHFGGRQHLQGILPDVPAERTIKGIREGRDELLEKALELAAAK